MNVSGYSKSEARCQGCKDRKFQDFIYSYFYSMLTIILRYWVSMQCSKKKDKTRVQVLSGHWRMLKISTLHKTIHVFQQYFFPELELRSVKYALPFDSLKNLSTYEAKLAIASATFTIWIALGYCTLRWHTDVTKTFQFQHIFCSKTVHFNDKLYANSGWICIADYH